MSGDLPVLLHIDFPYHGPWGEAMTEALADLAKDIACEPGLRWKLWLEDRDAARAGGAYLFDSCHAASRYLEKHRARLAAFGVTDLRIVTSGVHADLSRLTHADATTLLEAR